MNTKSIQSDFLSARAKTAVSIINATGWKEGTVNPEYVLADSIFLYVLDYQTKWVWACSVPRDSFYDVVEKAKSFDQNSAVYNCGKMIAKFASAEALSSDDENCLAILMICYLQTTKSYQLTENATKQNHFAVIRYGAKDTIRPFVLNGSARHMLPANTVLEYMNQVVSMDLQNHPEWIS